MPDTLLSFENVRVAFGSLLAVNDVSFELRGGDLMGLIGPNGAGKTTCLRAGTGLQPVTTGRIRIMGKPIESDPVFVGDHLGFTPDAPALYDALTVEQFLRFIGMCYRLPAKLVAERIDHWLERLWLTDKRASKVSTLSRGMKQRLGVARTLLSDPHVILLDEPAAGLDPAGRVEFRKLLASLRDSGKAIIVSSHILADLAEYCTHIGIMGHGKLLRFDTVSGITGAAQREKVRYRAALSRPIADLANRLAQLETIGGPRIDGDYFTFEGAAGRDDAAILLAGLIAAGLPIMEFSRVTESLEQAYLDAGIRQVD